jgi:hypothetical protein
MFDIIDDADLLMREPGLIPGCRAVASELFRGTADFNGVVVTNTSADWENTDLRINAIAYGGSRSVAGIIHRAVPNGFVAAVLRPFHRDGNRAFPEEDFGQSGLGNGTGQPLSIFTFPQAEAATRDVIDALGLSADLWNPAQLGLAAIRPVIACRALAIIMRGMATFDRVLVTPSSTSGTAVGHNANFRLAAEWYDRAFEREIRRARVLFDRDEDGRTDVAPRGDVLDPERS